jgi:hypothetical protein
MSSPPSPESGSRPPQPSLRDWITNWNQPLPLGTKLRLLARNIGIRISTGSNCCGHPGEPGC